MPDTAHRKWSKIITFDQSTLNTSKDGADIGDLELQSCSNFIFDNGVLEKAGGLVPTLTSVQIYSNGGETIISNDDSNVNTYEFIGSGAPVMGVFRSHDTYGNKSLLASSNGKISRYDTTLNTFIDVVTGMSVGARVDFLNDNNLTLITNGMDECLEFEPRNNSVRKFGLEPPRFYKKAAYFESDETIIHSGNGTTDTSFIKNTERTGKSKTSLKLTALATDTDTSYISFSDPQDFSLFPNGAEISTNDMLCVDILHRVLSYVDELYVDFWTSAGNYFRLTIDGTELDPISEMDNRWTTIISRKSRFISTGSPLWSNINRIYFSVKAQTGTAVVYFDNVYFKNAPLNAVPYGRNIGNFEGVTTDDWTLMSGTIGDEAGEDNVMSGTKSLRVTTGISNAASFYKSYVVTNFNFYEDGAPSPESDEISIWIKTAAPGVDMVSAIFTGATGNLIKTWSVSGGDIPYSSTQIWTRLKAKKSDFTGSQSNWTTINKATISIESTAPYYTLYLDDFKLGETQYIKQLADMESGETWVITGTGGVITDATRLSQGLQSIYLSTTKSSPSSASLDVATQNLTQFAAASEASTTDDFISFWTSWNKFNYISSIKLQIDCNAGDFLTDYFEYDWDKDVLAFFLFTLGSDISDTTNLDDKAFDLYCKKSEFRRIGTTSGKGWNTVEKYRFVVTASSSEEGPLLTYFDNIVMKRGLGISGLYQWCCVFQSPNAFSAPSEFSEMSTFSGERAILSNLPISRDTNILARHFYRKGGSLGDDARLDFSIYDNTTLSYSTGSPDRSLGERLNQLHIPQGTIQVPLAAKFGPIFRGSAILYRDPEDLRRLWFSNPKYHYAWSDIQLIILDSDLQDIFLDDGILYLSCKNGMRRISVPLDEVGPTDIEEIGSSKPSLSPLASTKAEQFRVVVSYDGVYVFNGQSFQLISRNIDTYFKELVYDLDEAIAFYADQHLYISIKSLAGVRTLLDAHGPQAQWRTSGEDINCFCILDGPGDRGEIYVGNSSGSVYQFNSGYETLAQAITKDFGAEGEESDPFNNIILTECHVIAKSVSEGGGQLQVQFRKDQALDAGVTLLFPVTGHLPNVYTVYSKMLRGEYNEVRGNKIGAILTHNLTNKHCAIQAIKLVGEITPLTSEYE